MGDITRHSVSVTAAVTREDGRVLVIKRDDDGRWVPPGGVLELAETPQQGCAREVLEETGYRVEIGPLTGVYKSMKLGVVSLAFRCALVEGEARTSEESEAVSWRTLEEIKQDVPEARAARVFDALHSSGVPVRIHDGSELIESISPTREWAGQGDRSASPASGGTGGILPPDRRD